MYMVRTMLISLFIMLVSNPQSTLSGDLAAAKQALREAVRVADTIPNEYVRENVLHDLAVAEVSAHDLTTALEIASEIRRQGDRDLTLLDMTARQAILNQIHDARHTASRIVNVSDRAAAMESIALAQLEGGDQTSALNTTNRFLQKSSEVGP